MKSDFAIFDCLVFGNKSFLCGLGRPGMHYVAQTDLKLLILLFHSVSGRILALYQHAQFNLKRIYNRPNEEGFLRNKLRCVAVWRVT